MRFFSAGKPLDTPLCDSEACTEVCRLPNKVPLTLTRRLFELAQFLVYTWFWESSGPWAGRFWIPMTYGVTYAIVRLFNLLAMPDVLVSR